MDSCQEAVEDNLLHLAPGEQVCHVEREGFAIVLHHHHQLSGDLGQKVDSSKLNLSIGQDVLGFESNQWWVVGPQVVQAEGDHHLHQHRGPLGRCGV